MTEPAGPPTKATLLEARRQLDFARQGYELLDSKRRALIAELTTIVAAAEESLSRLNEEFAQAYHYLQLARMTMGVEAVERVAIGEPKNARVKIIERSVMGVPVPTATPLTKEYVPRHSLAGATVEIDQATAAFESLLQLVAKAAGPVNSVFRLTKEISETQRRANALDNVVIPRYEATIAQIERILDEKEREAFIRAKMVKRVTERRSEEGEEEE